MLANTYHLWLRPGRETLVELGGLHRFMAWDRPILTDSGGFQVFSLESRRRLDDDGVTFRSHLDGSEHRFTPENVVAFQEALGVDIAMMLDVCVKLPASSAEIEESVRRTTLWARRGTAAWQRGATALFGIVQGGLDRRLREQSARELVALDLPGYADRRALGRRIARRDGQRSAALRPRCCRRKSRAISWGSVRCAT